MLRCSSPHLINDRPSYRYQLKNVLSPVPFSFMSLIVQKQENFGFSVLIATALSVSCFLVEHKH